MAGLLYKSMKMRRSILLVVSLSLMCSIGFGQIDFDSSISASFAKYKKAYLGVDRLALVSIAHPSIVEKGGGTSYYIEEITADFNMYSRQGFDIKDLVLKEASKIVAAGEDLQGMVPYIRTLSKGGEIILEEGFFLVTSQDKGDSWYFTDMNKYDAESIKVFLPNYNERLNIYVNSSSH